MCELHNFIYVSASKHEDLISVHALCSSMLKPMPDFGSFIYFPAATEFSDV